jgi:outer membrane protein assembly factor BamB
MKTARMFAHVTVLLVIGISVETVLANDWPSWRGHAQNGVSTDTNLPSTWSVDGENLIWSDAWIGRSTPAVFDGRVCANGRTGNGVTKKEVVACWDAENGTKLWEHSFGIANTTVPFNRVGWGSVTGDSETGFLYAMNIDGHFNAFDRNGNIVWTWRLAENLGRASGYGGRTSTPVIDEDQVILSIIGALWGDYGGPPRHRYFAFDKQTGEVQWIATPGGNVFDMNTQSVPIVTVINGQRLLIDGNADGHVYALQARTGEKIWEYNLSKRGINVSPIVDGTTVYVAHSEENVDQGTMGRVVAIDATGTGDITATHEKWRANELSVGFASPTLSDNTLYLIDNSANLLALDAERGNVLWRHSVGNVGKSSPVWADGKLYITEVNGNVHILQPNDTGVTVLDSDELTVEDGRYAEIYGSFAPAYGRLYLTAESGIYAIGNTTTAFSTNNVNPYVLGEEKPAGEIAHLQVIPAEIILSAGETATFEVRALDANGRLLGTRAAAWAVDGLVGATVSPSGVLSTSADSNNHGGKVVASVNGMTASAQVRVFAPLPWVENFESGRPPFWVGGGPRLAAVDVGGQQVFRKSASPNGLHRHAVYLGPAEMSGYTIQADMMATEWRRRRPDLGLVNSGYTLDLQGNAQRVQLQSWAAELRIDERTEFAWESAVWYTLKLRVDLVNGRAVIRGKVWERNEPEPSMWTVTAEDPQPIRNGSPGLIAYSPIDIYIDNVRVMENQ